MFMMMIDVCGVCSSGMVNEVKPQSLVTLKQSPWS